MESQQVMMLLKSKGFKNTPQRQALIEMLIRAEHPATAKELFEGLREAYPDISPDTVYRNLKVLCDLGVVNLITQQGKDGDRFELDGRPHHHHLVCVGCGKSVCLPYCPMADKAEALARGEEFQVVGHTFEIFGYCRDCQSNKEVSL